MTDEQIYSTETRRQSLAAQTFAIQTREELLALVDLQSQRITELSARIEELERITIKEKAA